MRIGLLTVFVIIDDRAREMEIGRLFHPVDRALPGGNRRVRPVSPGPEKDGVNVGESNEMEHLASRPMIGPFAEGLAGEKAGNGGAGIHEKFPTRNDRIHDKPGVKAGRVCGANASKAWKFGVEAPYRKGRRFA